jgi:hypothetical protein
LILVLLSSVTSFADQSPTDLVISEVVYDAYSSGVDRYYEWVEITNRGASEITVDTDWQICDNADNCGSFDEATTISPGEYWILCRDTTQCDDEVNLTGAFDAEHAISVGTDWPSLNNTGDAVVIYDGSGVLQDCVDYSDGDFCSNTAGGGTDTDGLDGADPGQSVSKIDTSWNYSEQVTGQTYGASPHDPNSWASGPTAVTFSSVSAHPRASQPWITVPALVVAGIGALGVLWRNL